MVTNVFQIAHQREACFLPFYSATPVLGEGCGSEGKKKLPPTLITGF